MPPPAKSTPSQKSVSSMLGAQSAKQSSITSFFQKTPQSSINESSITPLAEDTRAIHLEDEGDIVRPSKLQSGSKKTARILIEDEVPDSSPLKRHFMPAILQKDLSSTGAVPSSPLVKPCSHNIKYANQASFTPGDSIEDVNSGRYDWLVNVRDANGNSPSDVDFDSRTLFLPPSAWAKFTPMEKQFWEIKCKLMDTVVFFKKGKFYELYETDADIGAQMFDLKMTDRVNMRMVGVPEASFDWWAKRFVSCGYKIARVDQTDTSITKGMKDRENLGTKDKIIKRELSCILTSGTLIDPGLLTSDLATYCMAIAPLDKNVYEISFVDASTSKFKVSTIFDDACFTKLSTLLMQIRPKELVLPKSRISSDVLKLIKELVPDCSMIQIIPEKEFWDHSRTLNEIDLCGYFSALPETLSFLKSSTSRKLCAFGGLLWYLKELKLDRPLLSCPTIELYDPVQSSNRLVLDGQALANLDVLAVAATGNLKGSLFGLLDKCCTPFGRRLLRFWIAHPLRDFNAINDRLNLVEELMVENIVRELIIKELSKVPDLERILSRIFAGIVKVKDFLMVLDSFKCIEGFHEAVIKELMPESYLRNLFSKFPNYSEPLAYFKNSFDYDLARTEGSIIPAFGVNPNYDNAEKEFANVHNALRDYLKEQEESLGCPGMFRYKDLGKELFQLEVPVSVKVPSEYILMSKTKTVNRFWTPRIKDLVRQYQEADVRRSNALQAIFSDLLKQFSGYAKVWRDTVSIIGEIDCHLSLSRYSLTLTEPKCRPEVLSNSIPQSFIDIEDLRHPCIPMERECSFIPNSVRLGPDEARMILLTGPNMGGKSTLLRQTCLVTIMAQIGCFVPARSCRLTPVDRIFTRLGANDNILAGQSTFMVELSETSRILRECTSNSLVIIDELGRGTSTFDGLAIAQSVLAYLVEKSLCLGLFATHYRQLAVDMESDIRIKCGFMACAADCHSKRITFLYKLTSGISPKSYGTNVATLAGIPTEVIDEAEVIAQQFEASLSISERFRAHASVSAIDIFHLFL